MADQNQQVNQNINNQNDSDELFWWSDDIFENSDLLQPINSEIDSAHHVVKSQNDLNNFSGEIQTNSQDNISDNFENKWEQQDNLEQPENIENDDLFEQSQPEQNYDDHFENLYDDAWDKDDKWNTDDLWANDDIFDSSEVKEDVQEEPEIVDHIDEPQEEDKPEQEVQPEKVENQSQEELHPVEEIPQEKDEEDKQEKKEENNDEEDEDFDDDIDDIDDIDDEEDEDEEDKEEEYEDIDDNKENTKINDSNESWTANNNESKVQPNEAEEDDEEENDAPVENKNNEEESDEYFDDFGEDEEPEEAPKTDEEEKENITIQDYEKYDPNLFKTDVQKKFGELQWKTEQIHKLVGKEFDVWFDLLWWNDDRQKTIYKIISWEDYVEIEKEELNKEDESTKSNLLGFVLNWNNLEIYVNDVLLYNEIPDLQNDPNKKMQVLEKMNKFIFLLDEEYKKIQKYKKEKEERNAVKWVFRNF